MPTISFPDGSKKIFKSGVSPLSIAEEISNSLKKNAVIAKVNGEFWDLNREILEDSDVSDDNEADDTEEVTKEAPEATAEETAEAVEVAPSDAPQEETSAEEARDESSNSSEEK